MTTNHIWSSGISSSYGDNGHEDGLCRGKSCLRCRDGLQAAIEWDMNDGEEQFDDGFGDMIEAMHGALAAIHRFRREVYADKCLDSHNSQEAAQRLVQVADAIHAAVVRGEARYS